MTTTDLQEERRLVEAAQADPARFLELYDRYFHRVWAYAVRRAASRAEAEDLTSEVFRKALEHLSGYQWRGTPFAAWLLRIAANTLATRWHQTAREAGAPPGELAAPDADLERRAMLYELVARLPDAQRRVVELRFVEGRSVAEVARALGKTDGAVKQLQRRALDGLRAALEASHG